MWLQTKYIYFYPFAFHKSNLTLDVNVKGPKIRFVNLFYSGTQMTGLSSLPAWAILTIILLLTSVLNEVVSNATTASILLPVLKNIAIQLKLNPLYLMLPVVLSCNYTFMFPASSPTNAIVYKVCSTLNNLSIMKR